MEVNADVTLNDRRIREIAEPVRPQTTTNVHETIAPLHMSIIIRHELRAPTTAPSQSPQAWLSQS
jgi:hypothetical protein